MPRFITPSHSSGWWSPPFDDEQALVEMKPCRVVNGALEYIAKDLGFAADPVLQGWVVSSTLAGATVGSFTGGSLADKIGRRRTFQLDAIPLLIGTLLSANAAGFQAMVIGRILVGFGIGVSSGVVPLYISEVNIMLSNPHYAFAVSKAKMESSYIC
jgi:MFS family permease